MKGKGGQKKEGGGGKKGGREKGKKRVGRRGRKTSWKCDGKTGAIAEEEHGWKMRSLRSSHLSSPV